MTPTTIQVGDTGKLVNSCKDFTWRVVATLPNLLLIENMTSGDRWTCHCAPADFLPDPKPVPKAVPGQRYRHTCVCEVEAVGLMDGRLLELVGYGRHVDDFDPTKWTPHRGAPAMTDRPVTPAALTALVEKWRAEQLTYPETLLGKYAAAAVRCCADELEAAMRAVLAPALEPKMCATCKHGEKRADGERLCDRPELVDVGYASVYFHVPTEEFGCTLHAPAEKGPRT